MDHTPANLAVNAPSRAAPADGEDAPRCRRCEYDLRGLPTGRCPECGLAFDPDDVPVADIPWLRRAALGTWRAYWATVWLCVTRPDRLARMAQGKVDVNPLEAEAFAGICIVAALGSFACVLAALLFREPKALLAVTSFVLPPLLLFLWGAHQAVITMDWRKLGIAYMDRLARLKPFTAAPLGASPAVAAPLVAIAVWEQMTAPRLSHEVLTAAAVAPVALLLAWWCVAVVFHGSNLRFEALRAAVYGFVIASVWGAVAVAAGAVMVIVAMAADLFGLI